MHYDYHGDTVERLIDDGFLEGTVGVERNDSPDGRGRHGWGVFRGRRETYVIDPAQDFMGTKEEARRDTRRRWPYDLSTDAQNYGPYPFTKVA